MDKLIDSSAVIWLSHEITHDGLPTAVSTEGNMEELVFRIAISSGAANLDLS